MVQCSDTKRSGTIGFGRRCTQTATKADGFCNGHRAVRVRQARQDAFWTAERERFASEHPNPPCKRCEPGNPESLGLCHEHYEATVSQRLAELRGR